MFVFFVLQQLTNVPGLADKLTKVDKQANEGKPLCFLIASCFNPVCF